MSEIDKPPVDPAEHLEFLIWKEHRASCLKELKSLVETVNRKRLYLADLEREIERAEIKRSKTNGRSETDR